MAKTKQFIYPAEFTEYKAGKEQGFYIRFPDLEADGGGIFTYGLSLPHGIRMAREALSLHLECLLKDNIGIPVASDIRRFKNTKTKFVTYISCRIKI